MACPSCRGRTFCVRSSVPISYHISKGGQSRWVPSWVQICSRFLPTVVPDRSRPLLLWRVSFWLYKALRDAFRCDLVLCKQKLINWLFVCCCAVPQTPWPSSSSCRSRSNSSQSRWCQWWRALAAQAPGALACVTAAATWAPVSHSRPQDFSFFLHFEWNAYWSNGDVAHIVFCHRPVGWVTVRNPVELVNL